MSGTSEDEHVLEMHDYGIALDEEKERVECNYCGTEISGGFAGLRRHLTGKDSCPETPQTVKSRLKKRGRLRTQVGKLLYPTLPLKRHLFSSSDLNVGCQDNVVPNSPKKSVAKETKRAVAKEQGAPVPFFKREAVVAEPVNFAEKAVGDFFTETGIDPVKVNLPSFKTMIDAAVALGSQFRTPSCKDISGRILEHQVCETLDYVNGMKACWKMTGCTILLDTWANQAGKNLISFLVSCAGGTVFLRSVDISDDIHDVDAMFSLMSDVIEEVGKENVVQVITHDVTPHMQDIGHRVTQKYRIYWNLCADYCIDMMLGKIAKMERVSQVLDVARAFTCFVYSREYPSQLLNEHLNWANLVKPGWWRNVAQFKTLANIVLHRENLIGMLNSSSWTSASWASRPQATSVVENLKRDAFWVSASNILKVTEPLVDVLDDIFGPKNTPMGTLYDAVDRAKELMKSGLGSEAKMVSPFWKIIDDIWDHYLHSPIHAAGCFLNPALSYAAKVVADRERNEDVDEEITRGLYDCNAHMARELGDAIKVCRQIDAYKLHSGAFSDVEAERRAKTIAPVTWWNMHGGQCPELQRLAKRVLSQPCCGASRFNLDHRLSEEALLSKGITCVQRQLLLDREFVRNNRIVCCPDMDVASVMGPENFDALGDWVQ